MRALRLFDESGNIKNSARVLDQGFEVGMTVIRKADKQVGVIQAITAEHVQLDLDGKQFKASSDSFVEGKWKRHTAVKDPEEMDEWIKHSPLESPDFSIGIARGSIFQAMYDQYSNFAEEKSLKIFLKPRGVVSNKTFATNILKVPVATTRIDFKAAGQKSQPGAIKIGIFEGFGETLEVSIVPLFTAPKASQQGFVSPAWAMQTSSKKEEANMEIQGWAKGWENQKIHEVDVVQVPCLRNFKKISSGDHLILYRPDLARSEPVEVLEPVSKKARK